MAKLPRPDDDQCNHEKADQGSGPESHGLVEIRRHAQRQRRVHIVPDAVTSRGPHPEGVGSRRHVGEEGGAPVTGFDPIALETIEAVLEAQVVRSQKAESRVLDFEVPLLGLQLQLPRAGPTDGRQSRPLGTHILDPHRDRDVRPMGRGRIDDRRTGLHREPEPTIARDDGGGLHPAVCLSVPQTVPLGVRDRMDAARPTRREILEVRTKHPEYPPVATHPVAARTVVEDRVHAVGIESVATPDHCYRRIGRGRLTAVRKLYAVESAVLGPDPQNAGVVLMDRPHEVAGQPVRGVEALEAPAVIARHTASVRPKP